MREVSSTILNFQHETALNSYEEFRIDLNKKKQRRDNTYSICSKESNSCSQQKSLGKNFIGVGFIAANEYVKMGNPFVAESIHCIYGMIYGN